MSCFNCWFWVTWDLRQSNNSTKIADPWSSKVHFLFPFFVQSSDALDSIYVHFLWDEHILSQVMKMPAAGSCACSAFSSWFNTESSLFEHWFFYLSTFKFDLSVTNKLILWTICWQADSCSPSICFQSGCADGYNGYDNESGWNNWVKQRSLIRLFQEPETIWPYCYYCYERAEPGIWWRQEWQCCTW